MDHLCMKWAGDCLHFILPWTAKWWLVKDLDYRVRKAWVQILIISTNHRVTSPLGANKGRAIYTSTYLSLKTCGLLLSSFHFLLDHKDRFQGEPSYQLLWAPHMPTRAFHWLLLRHRSGPLGSAIPLGQPLSKHLCFEDFKLGPFLCLGEGWRVSMQETRQSWPIALGSDPASNGKPLTVISPFFLASFINFFLFFFPLKAKSNSCRTLATGMKRGMRLQVLFYVFF